MKVKSLSRVRLLATPWTAAYQAPPSIGFSSGHVWMCGMSQLSGLGQIVLQLLSKSVLQLHFIYKIAGESKTRREESGGVHGEGEREREKERERESGRMHAGERVLEKALWLLLLYVFPPPGPALCKLGLARSAVCSA